MSSGSVGGDARGGGGGCYGDGHNLLPSATVTVLTPPLYPHTPILAYTVVSNIKYGATAKC